MTECVRCDQPIEPGEFYLRVEYIPKDIQDLIRQPQCPPDQQGLLSRWSPYGMHVTCPTFEPEAS